MGGRIIGKVRDEHSSENTTRQWFRLKVSDSREDCRLPNEIHVQNLLDKEPICVRNDATLALVLEEFPLASCTRRRPAPGQTHGGPHGAVEWLTVDSSLHGFFLPPGLSYHVKIMLKKKVS